MTDAPTIRLLPPSGDRRPGRRAALVILATLLLGMILGALMTGYFVRQRLAAVYVLNEQSGLERAFYKAVDPTPEQREAIAPILADAREGMIVNLLGLRGRMQVHMDSTLDRLDVHLDDEQMEETRQLLRVRPQQEFLRQVPDDLRERIEQADRERGRPAL
ncbi:MAG: hypothetical protein AAF791_02120 [Bacteroidota bacterium]